MHGSPHGIDVYTFRSRWLTVGVNDQPMEDSPLPSDRSHHKEEPFINATSYYGILFNPAAIRGGGPVFETRILDISDFSQEAVQDQCLPSEIRPDPRYNCETLTLHKAVHMCTHTIRRSNEKRISKLLCCVSGSFHEVSC